MFYLLGTEYLHKLFKILLLRRFVFSPPLIYLFNNLFISVWNHEYLFHIMSYKFNTTLFTLLLWPWGALSRGFCVSLNPITLGFWKHFFTSGIRDAPSSSCIFPVPGLESATS